MLQSPDFAKAPQEKLIPIEIAEVPPSPTAQKRPPTKQTPKEKEKEIAETQKLDNEKIDPKSTILSEKNQTAEEQMKAKRTDDFRDKKGTGLAQDNTLAQEKSLGLAPTADTEATKKTEEIALGDGDLTPKPSEASQGVKRNWKTLSLKDLSVGGDGGAEAATDDRLSNIKEGDRTILSTREFKYFSYYNRVKDLLRQYWKPSVERKLAKLYNRGRVIGETEMTTKVLVLLDDAGRVQKVSRVEGSGIDEIDLAAIEAFERAAPFPNPPKALVEADGFVRLRWDFILKTESAPIIQFRSMGGAPSQNY